METMGILILASWCSEKFPWCSIYQGCNLRLVDASLDEVNKFPGKTKFLKDNKGKGVPNPIKGFGHILKSLLLFIEKLYIVWLFKFRNCCLSQNYNKF